jgi:hypothetical protein
LISADLLARLQFRGARLVAAHINLDWRNRDMADNEKFHLIVNKAEKPWDAQTINGAQIKGLAGSPAEYVVNQIIPGPTGDPEIGDAQEVDLSEKVEPKGIKRFTTRKATTAPGARS